MKKTIIIPLAAGLFIVIVIGAGIVLSIKNKEQLAAINKTATTTTDTSGTISTAAANASTSTTTPTPVPVAATPPAAAKVSGYKDGTYSAQASYDTPERGATVKVSITVKSSAITAVSVTQVSGDRDSKQYVSMFNSGIGGIVTGKSIDSSFNVSQVNGSSLTGIGFTQALQAIRSQAKV